MAVPEEFITSLVIGTISTLIGIATIWVVRWQTYVLIGCQADDEERLIRLLARQSSSASGSADAIELQPSKTPELPSEMVAQTPGVGVDRTDIECAHAAEQHNAI